MKKKQKQKKIDVIALEEDEKTLLDSFENGEWETIEEIQNEKKKALKAAARTLKKDTRINIRLSSSDVSLLKQKAAYEGIPYQTLISSILHKFAAGHLRL